jgi:hypothetical protein
MAVQPQSAEATRLAPQKPALGPPEAPPAPAEAPVVELMGRRVAPAPTASRGVAATFPDGPGVLPHQLHELDQVVEIARLSELLVEKDGRIALLERGIAGWRERAQAAVGARAAAERLAFERERELVGVIHQQLNALEIAETNVQSALSRNDELQSRLDDQVAAIESSEQTSQAALARMHELQARVDELDDQLRRSARRWWRRRRAA